MGTDPIDVRGVLNRSARTTSLEELRGKGIGSVRLIDEKLVERLIHQAVERIVGRRAHEWSRQEQERIYREARRELDVLVRERSEAAAQDRAGLLQENQYLRRQVELMARTSAQEAHRLREQIAELTRRLEEASSGRVLEEIGALRRDLAATKDQAILEAVERLARKVEAIRVKVSPEEVAYAPGMATLEEILGREVESNLESVGVSDVRAAASGDVAAALARLREIRKSGP